MKRFVLGACLLLSAVILFAACGGGGGGGSAERTGTVKIIGDSD